MPPKSGPPLPPAEPAEPPEPAASPEPPTVWAPPALAPAAAPPPFTPPVPGAPAPLLEPPLLLGPGPAAGDSPQPNPPTAVRSATADTRPANARPLRKCLANITHVVSAEREPCSLAMKKCCGLRRQQIATALATCRWRSAIDGTPPEHATANPNTTARLAGYLGSR